MRPILCIACVLLSASAMACGSPVKEASDAVKDAGDAAKEATKNLENGMKAVADGMAKIDPAGIRQLLNDNAELRKAYEEVVRRYGEFQGSGAIDIQNRRAQVVITELKGEFTLNGWTNNRDRWFWNSRYVREGSFNFPLDLTAMYYKIYRQVGGICDFNCWMNQAGAMAQKEVQQAYDGIVRGGLPQPEDLRTVDLNTMFGGSGIHSVSIELIPRKPSSDGRWLVRGRFELQDPQGRKEVAGEFERRSEDYSIHQMNAPLPLISRELLVQAK